MGLTIEQLYEAYMNTGDYATESKDFGEDIWDFFAPGRGGDKITELTAEQFTKDYGMYIPTYDPVGEHFAFEDKALSFMNAANTYSFSKDATDRVFSEEMRKVSGGLEEDIAKGKQLAGGIGLRSGALESALADTMTSSANRATNLGDRLDIQQEKDLNIYNQKMVDTTLDYDKDMHETKEEFYNRVLASVEKLAELGAFRLHPDIGTGGMDNNTNTMANNSAVCVEMLGPEPLPGTDEFNEEYEKMYGPKPLESYWGRVADCQGVPFNPPDTPPDEWDYDFSGALGM